MLQVLLSQPGDYCASTALRSPLPMPQPMGSLNVAKSATLADVRLLIGSEQLKVFTLTTKRRRHVSPCAHTPLVNNMHEMK